jgi:peptide/nickel transport system permease protein
VPNIIGYAVISFTFGIGGAILTEAGISYLGLGVPLPTPSWGNLIQQANSITVLQVYWWMWVPPSVALVLCVLGLNAIGDALRDVFDPYQGT